MTQITRSIPKTSILNVFPFGGYRLRMTGLMLFADLAGLTLAIVSGHFLTAAPFNFHFFDPGEVEHILVLGIILLVSISSRLYPGVGINPAEEIKLVTQFSSSALIIGMMLNVVLHPARPDAAVTMLSIWVCSIVSVLLMRWSMRILAVQAGIWGEPVVVLARGTQVDELSQYFLQRCRLGFIPVLAATDPDRRMTTACPVPVVSMSSLIADSQNRWIGDVETILIEASFFGQNFMDHTYLQLSSRFKHIIFVSDMGWMEGASLAVRDFEGLIGIEARRNLIDSLSSAIKRVVDIVGSLAGMVLFSPFLLLIGVLIKLDSPGPVFYTQPRVGLDGKYIRIYKFRTMVQNAEQALAEYLRANPKAQHEWEETQKLRDDPRITRVGKFLRKFSIDEVPQLSNVLLGDMSLVGPRPIEVNQVKLYGENIDTYRGVRPGMTGLWQVSGRNRTTF